MTDAQNSALEKIREILREHFEASIVVVETEDDEGTAWREVQWDGGITTCVGLCKVAEARFMHRIAEQYED